MYFIHLLFWYMVKRAPFWHQKISEIFGHLHWFICMPLTLCFIFFFFSSHFVSAICSICRPLLLNAKLLCNAFFYFCLKRANNKERVNRKKKRHRKIVSFSLKIQNFATLFTSARVTNIIFFWVCAIFTNTKVGNICRYCSLTPESGIWYEEQKKKKKKKKKENKLLEILDKTKNAVCLR
jgi:hypothetical protein